MKIYKPYIVFTLLVLLFIYPGQGKSQLRVTGEPASSTFSLPLETEGKIVAPSPDLSMVRQQDEQFPSPYRFGIVVPVDVGPDRSGSWTVMSDGSEIWRASVSAPGALALSAYFDRFYIPEGGKLFIYDPAKTKISGAYTLLNNSTNGLFSTELIPGSEIVLEYIRPVGEFSLPEIHMNEITYAYRGVEIFYRETGSPQISGKCEVNVICPEGDDWQSQKEGVVKIHVKRDGGAYWCTGSLLNNTNLDNLPYILTANHCGFNSTAIELNQWVFYFDYESSVCASSVYPPIKALIGATMKAHSGNQQAVGSDFYLVRLNQEIPDTFHVYYNGWSRSEDNPSPSGVGIHHPGGDLKKISTYTAPLQSISWMGNPGLTHWQVAWVKTVSGHGVTEPGSSGSPLFNNKGQVVGMLSSGESACDSAHINLPDYYGKFSWAWSSDGADSTRRLKDWLDPSGTNLFVLDGRYTNSIDTVLPYVEAIYPNPFENEVTVSIMDLRNRTVQINVYDLPGRILFSSGYQLNNSGSFTISLGFLPRGLYILRMETEDATISRKIIRR